MLGQLYTFLPKTLEQRITALLLATAVLVGLVVGMAVNTFNQREQALAMAYEVGHELALYFEASPSQGPFPAPYAGQFIQVVPTPEALKPEDYFDLPILLQFGEKAVRATLLFDGRPSRADLIEARYDLSEQSATRLGALAKALARQDLTARLLIPDETASGLGGVVVSAPRVWSERLTEPMVVIFAACALLVIVVGGRMLAHFCAQPFRSLAEHDRANLQPWDTEEAVVLQDKLLEQQDARATMLSEQTRMLASISHDLRTPATRLRLRLEQIESAAIRNRMLQDVEEMTQLITASLDFLRFDVRMEEPQQLSLGALLQSLCDDYVDTGHDVTFIAERHARADQAHSIFGGGGEVELAVEGRAVMNGRPTALRRAFTNLIDNALKYGGAATVQLQSHLHDRLKITVSDPGPGIPAHLHERVFEPFFRNDSNERTRSSSVGLGLSIVQQIVKAHGGVITLGETADGQFCIIVELPREL